MSIYSCFANTCVPPETPKKGTLFFGVTRYLVVVSYRYRYQYWYECLSSICIGMNDQPGIGMGMNDQSGIGIGVVVVLVEH